MPDEGTTAWDDAIKGRIEFPNEKLEDVVLLRSDGRPDVQLRVAASTTATTSSRTSSAGTITSRTRRSRFASSRRMGVEPPVYAHVPNVFGEDGRKLSKRHGAVSVEEFRAAGYVAPALMNYLALLGWSLDSETTIMSRDEMVAALRRSSAWARARRRSTTRSSSG